MARDFDGANDVINFGNDASIGGWEAKSFAYWLELDTVDVDRNLVVKDNYVSQWGGILGDAGASTAMHIFRHNTAALHGVWYETSLTIPSTVRYHIAWCYNCASADNDPTLYINGVSQGLTELVTPNATGADDSGDNLRIGTDNSNSGDVDGRYACFTYANEVFDSAAVNRAMWWGRPHGGLAVYHPMWAEKLTNEGTATADGSASGTSVAAFAIPTVRPGTALMGTGVGW